MTAQKIIESKGADADKAYGLWKAFTDGLILSQDEERLRLACRLTWERLFPDKAYKEPCPLHSFGYFLQMEVQEAQKLKIT